MANGPIFLTILDLRQDLKEKFLLQRVQRHRKHTHSEGKQAAVMVIGIENTLDYTAADSKNGDGLAILRNANFHREAFRTACPVPLVLWLNVSAATTFYRAAGDLWHWRSGVFEFHGSGEEQAMPSSESDLSNAPSKPESVEANDSIKRTYLNAVIEQLDYLELFGADIPPGARRQLLSVAMSL